MAQDFLITAGPTREPIDPVRYLTNRSSGKMGYAIAAAAQQAGHSVCLISGPVNLTPPAGVRVVQVETAAEMYAAVEAEISNAQVAIFSAAVADYTPAHVATDKLKKSAYEMTLHLVKTKDILGSARQPMGFAGFLVGFAAETTEVAAYAQDKLKRKACDLLVANDVSRKEIGFDSQENQISLFWADGQREDWPQASKTELGRLLVAKIQAIVAARANDES